MFIAIILIILQTTMVTADNLKQADYSKSGNISELIDHRQDVPEWLLRFGEFLKTEEGQEYTKRLLNFLTDAGLLVGNEIGHAIASNSEEIVKGIMRGLTDKNTVLQFTNDFSKILEDFGKNGVVVPISKIFEEARKELVKQGDDSIDDIANFGNRNSRKVFRRLLDTFEDLGHDFENEFKKNGRSYQMIQRDAGILTDAFGDAGESVTKGLDKNFGKDSASYKNISKIGDDYGALFQRTLGHIQKGVIFNTLQYFGTGVGLALVPSLLVRYTYHYFISKLNDPRIIIETSIGSWPYEYAKWLFRFKPRKAAEKLENMILAPKIKERIQEIIAFEKAHINAKEGLDNILLEGYPGTGKTMFAKAIAAELGMDYIILTGSSFFQENAGVKAIDQIFGKLIKGRKVVIFIDEIDSIISSRVGKNSDSDAYRLLNQLLNYTSTPNKNFILIGATNYPELIDKAFYRRFQHVIEMPLPEYDERVQFLKFAKTKYLISKNKKQNEQIQAIFNDRVIKDVATKTDKMSYAELQTIIEHIKSATRLSKNGLTEAIIYKTMKQVIDKESLFKRKFL